MAMSGPHSPSGAASAAASARFPLSLWRTPTLADPISQREANLVFSVLRAQAVGLLAFALLVVALSFGIALPEERSTVAILVASTGPIWAAMWFAHHGRLRWASTFAVFTAVASTAASTLLFGGLRSSIVLTLVFGPLVASILLGRRAMLGVGGLVLVFVFVDAALETAGLAPLLLPIAVGGSIMPSLIPTAATLAIFIAVLYVYSREVDRANSAELDAGKRAVESERLLADLVRESPDGIAVLAEDGRLLSVNAALERMSGYAAAELVGQHLLQLPGAPDPETKSRLKQGLEEMGQVTRLRELTLVRKDGTPYVVETNPRALTLPGGQRILQVVIRDVTARVEAERHRRRLELDLLDARRMEGLGRLAGGLAHDLRNMLTPVLMNVGELREEPQLSASARVMVNEIEASGHRASELLGQILAFARRQRLEVTVVDVNGELRALEPMLRRLIRGDIDVSFMLDPALRPIRADRGQFGQVVVNLVANARDAMPAGGKLTLQTRNVELSAAYAADHPGVTPGAYSCLIVTDTGEGMSEQVRQHVFDPFFTTKGSEEGVGLGLATVHGIVSQSGGSIQVDSEPGRGAAFRVYLPSVASAPAPTPAPDTAAPPAGVTPQVTRLLVVDDEDMVRSTVVRALRRAGMEVLEAASAAEGLARAREFEGAIDLLITDVVMPGMGGPDLAKELAKSRPGMKVLFVSGYTDLGPKGSGAVHEGAALLTKPFMPADLLRQVRAMLGHSH
jgi:two-component system cell cycle sensor histidine kinase/response regulator CckA